MKKLITFLLILLSAISFSQNGVLTDSLMQLGNSIYSLDNTNHFMFANEVKPSFLVITFQDKELRFEAKGDSLIASGNLSPNKAAKEFIEHVLWFYNVEIPKLRNELEKCKKDE